MTESQTGRSTAEATSWIGWCCSYCAAPLRRHAHGLSCAAEERWFATIDGVHRLLTEERRRDLRPWLELHGRSRRDEPAAARAARDARADAVLREALAAAALRLGPGALRVLDIAAGDGRLSAALLQAGHAVVAVDVDVELPHGLAGAARWLEDPQRLPRAEAEMESLPFEPATFDLVVAHGALHQAPRLGRALVELRRVTRRGGMLLAFESPTYRWRPDGEAEVAARMKEQTRRYGIAAPRESQPGYLVLGELLPTFSRAGWALELQRWPRRVREALEDVWPTLHHGRRHARWPLLVAQREG